MSRASDQLHDAPDAVTYLNLVKLQLAKDEARLKPFLEEVRKWVSEQNVASEAVHKQDFSASIIRIASILRFKPKLLHGLNALLGPPQRVECSTMGDEVKYFVLIGQTGARIFSTFDFKVPYPSSDLELRRIVISKPSWDDLLEADRDKDWLTCISQLLQILDDPSTEPECARRAFRCLRELAQKSILPPSIFINNLDRGKGHAVQGGSFADIYIGKMRGAPVCFRVLRMFETPPKDRELLFKEFCSELLLWRQLRHANILPLMGANLELFAPQFCFISPWLDNGDIMSYLKQNPKHDRFTSICEIVEGIEYLHGLDPPVTHKDIKGANVLVGDDLVCRLADFGLSSIVESQRLGRGSPAFEGSVCWMGPEVMDPSRIEVKNPKAGDIYALACTIYEIYTGNPPFLDTIKVPVTIMLAVLRGQRPALPPPGKWSSDEEQLWWLVGLCWEEKPEFRPEMHLIKRTLQDIGTFKPKVSQITSLTSPELHDSTGRLREIEYWLNRECEQEKQFSSNAIGVKGDQRNISSQQGLLDWHNDTIRLNDKERPWTSERNVRQPYSLDSSLPNGREKPPRLSFSSQDMRVSGQSQGLMTPNTPSMPLAHFDLTSIASGVDSDSPVPDRNNVGIQIAATEITRLPSSLSNLTQLRPSGAPFPPTPPSTPLPSHYQHRSSRLTCEISMESSQVTSVDAEAKALRTELSIAPVYHPPSHSLRSSRPPFLLPAHLRQSNVKYGSRPPVNKPSINPNRALSFSPAQSPLNRTAQSTHPPCNRTGISADTPHSNPISIHENSESPVLPVLKYSRPVIGSSPASSSRR